MNLSKNNSIPLFRIIMTYIIAAFHFHNSYPYIDKIGLRIGWYIPVEFFFIVSGFLLYETANSGKYKDVKAYVISRYKRIYPGYIISFVLVFLSMVILKRREETPLRLLWGALPEIFGLQILKPNRGWFDINPTLWFISALFIDGAILHFIITKFNKVYVRYIGPAVTLIIYAVLFFRFGHLDVVVDMDGLINYPLLRGFAGMTLGIYSNLLYHAMERSGRKVLYGRVMLVLMLILSVGTLYKGRDYWDYIFTLLFVFGVAGCFTETKNPVLTSRAVKILDSLSLYIYLIHELFRSYVFPTVFGLTEDLDKKLILLPLYLISVTAGAFILKLLSELLLKSLEKLFGRGEKR